MKKIKVQNQKRANAKRYLLFTVIFFALSVIMITNAVSSNKKLSEDLYNDVEGIVVTLESNETEYTLTLEGQEAIILNLTTDTTLKDNLKSGDTVKMVYNKDAKEIYKLTINDELKYDRLADALKSNKGVIIFYIIIGVVMLGILAYNVVVMVKEPQTKEIDYIEHVITNSRALTNSMMKKESKTMKLIQKDQMLNKGLMFAMVIVFIALLFSKQLFDNQYIIIISSVIVLVLMFIAVYLLKPKFYSKHLSEFVNDYLDYLNNGDLKDERTIFFEKESLRINEKENTYNFEYSDLNLFTVLVFSKTQVPVNIFICSKLPEKEEFKQFEDLIIPLSRDLYKDAIDNDINIAGLEEVVNNLYEETKSNISLIKHGMKVKYYE